MKKNMAPPPHIMSHIQKRYKSAGEIDGQKDEQIVRQRDRRTERTKIAESVELEDDLGGGDHRVRKKNQFQ